MKAKQFWINITTYPQKDRKRSIHWIPRVYRFKIVADDLKSEWMGYELLWLNLVIHFDLQHTLKHLK